MQLISKDKERIEQASQKQKTRELKLSAISAAHQANVEELQRKIQSKQEATEKRKQENMDQIRQKAFELSVRRCSEFHNEEDAPKSTPYDTQKMCSVCRVLIGSEIYLYSHLRGKRHQDAIRDQHEGKLLSCEELELYNLKHIVDAPAGTSADDLNPELASLDKERLKSIKKRCTRLRQRMTSKSVIFEQQFKTQIPVSSPSANKAKIIKCKKEIESILVNNSLTDTSSLHTMDRCFKLLEKLIANSKNDKLLMISTGTIDPIIQIFQKNRADNLSNRSESIPDKTLCNICRLIETVCVGTSETSFYIFNSNVVTVLLDFLEHRLTVSFNYSVYHPLYSRSNFSLLLQSLLNSPPSLQRKYDVVAGSISRCLSAIFDTLVKSISLDEGKDDNEPRQRGLDVVRYENRAVKKK